MATTVVELVVAEAAVGWAAPAHAASLSPEQHDAPRGDCEYLDEGDRNN
eukprot:CAMPEP_0119084272 /NCGR_PEP_ID=MMETSP1178-20130426/129020_1 /TAXON_ID=33656 /ORGANISM="unid sp, Strain CCMP2000" /LENGTH=48 /DNA_ID= /DNA_START= /DNA_END= /DNA_ORIENTATION=